MGVSQVRARIEREQVLTDLVHLGNPTEKTVRQRRGPLLRAQGAQVRSRSILSLLSTTQDQEDQHHDNRNDEGRDESGNETRERGRPSTASRADVRITLCKHISAGLSREEPRGGDDAPTYAFGSAVGQSAL
jgi:hypothetical protein